VIRAGTVLTIALAVVAGTAHAQVTAASAPSEAATVPTPDGEDEDPGTSSTDDEADEDPCLAVEVGEDELVDRLNRRLYTSVCGTARWFDGFFGDDRAFNETRTTYGYFNLGVLWTRYEGVTPRGRGRAHVDFPNLERRASAFVGRVDPEAYLSDTEEMGEAGRVLRGDDTAEWLLGFGFTPLDRGSKRLTTSVGVRATWPPDPYVRVHYRWYYLFTSEWLFRWRQTVFWEGEEGAGTTVGLDLEKRLSTSTLMRATASHTWSESTLGVAWWNELSLFRQLDERLALAVRLWSNGETDAPVDVREYGIRFVFRRRLSREWLFGEVGTGVYWPREFPEERREPSPGLWIAVEMQFGNVRGDPEAT
jgi:hypothetical protein